jgi:ribonuclease E
MDRHNKMLIDATHPEETRVVVLRNGRVEEFDYESAARKLLRGNIYLAKVTRVEPSLQAAFVDYGGNRHGFLAFSEIHPDYYQIPVADREMLKREEAEDEARAEAEADERAHSRPRRGRRNGPSRRGEAGDTTRSEWRARSGDGETVDEAPPYAEREPSDDTTMAAAAHDDVRYSDPIDRPREDDAPYAGATNERDMAYRDAANDDAPEAHGNVEDIGVDDVGTAENGNGEIEPIEDVATDGDALEEVPERPRRRMRSYKIQEVIKRRQIILVQVVKEERGNKGAALTTYISLAGRYTVLMPNTGRGGGISRKITQPQDRKRLKAIAEELDVPEGMGLIIRTAGAARTQQEIKRDYEYLLRLWESVRELTLSSTAPCLVYEEGNLIKRSIRDLYSKDVEQVVVAGREAYREASDFMGMLMPGHDENVVSYDGSEPLFTRFGIERQLNAMFSPYVTLRSGGYLVINQTEALVAIDVNSGKSTREFSIEETAYATNCEAAEEIARQLKLRDLAGLIVIDFIDMEEKRNNRTVERRLKDALRHDRARIQIGRISHFGLLEMSRQRLRTGVLEGSTTQCPHCQGTGIIRSTESVALAVLRGLEDNLMKQPASLMATTTPTVALYILNHKRAFINDMEARHGISIAVEASERMQGANFSIDRIAAAPTATAKPVSRGAVSMDWGFEGGAEEEEVAATGGGRDSAPARDHAHHHSRGRGRDRDEDDVSARDADRETDRDGGRDRDRDAEGGENQSGGRRRRRRRGRRDGGDGAAHSDRSREAGSGREPDRAAPREAGEWEAAGPREHREFATDDRDDRVRADSPDRDMEAASDADRPGDAEAAPGEARENGEPQRRGRRRGRRGGRGRGREGGEASPREPDQGNGSPADTWGREEISRPGAEQPPLSDDPRFDTGRSPRPPVAAMPLREPAPRPSIVEIVDVDARAARTEADRPEPVRIIETSIVAMSSGEDRSASEKALPGGPTSDRPAAPPDSAPTAAPEAPASPPRRGWWNRTFAS